MTLRRQEILLNHDSPGLAPGPANYLLGSLGPAFWEAWTTPVERHPTPEHEGAPTLGVTSGSPDPWIHIGDPCPPASCFLPCSPTAVSVVNRKPRLTWGGWSQRREPVLSW